MGKKRVRRLTCAVFLALAVCTGASRQIQQMLLPKVSVAPVEKGSVTHGGDYPAAWADEAAGIVSWQVEGDAYAYFTDVSDINFCWSDAEGEGQTRVFPILERRQGPDGSWTCAADVSELAAEAGALDLSGAYVSMKKTTDYDYTVPVSALSRRGDSYVVYTIETTQGVFSDEQTAQEWPVTVLDRDGVRAAVSTGRYGEVVTYASKPLASRMRVAVTQ